MLQWHKLLLPQIDLLWEAWHFKEFVSIYVCIKQMFHCCSRLWRDAYKHSFYLTQCLLADKKTNLTDTNPAAPSAVDGAGCAPSETYANVPEEQSRGLRCCWAHPFSPLCHISPGVEVSHAGVDRGGGGDGARALPCDDRLQTGTQRAHGGFTQRDQVLGQHLGNAPHASADHLRNNRKKCRTISVNLRVYISLNKGRQSDNLPRSVV